MSIFSSIKNKISSLLKPKPQTSSKGGPSVPDAPMSTNKGPRVPDAAMSTNKGPSVPDAPMSKPSSSTSSSKGSSTDYGYTPYNVNGPAKPMGVSTKKPSSGGSSGGSSKTKQQDIPTNQIDYAAFQKQQDSIYGKQVSTGSVGGVEYQITGDPATDAANKERAREIAQKNKDSERYNRIKEENQAYTNQGLIQQLIDLQKRTYEKASPYIANLAMLKSRNAQQITNTLGSAGDESLQTGRAGIYQQAAAQQEAVRQAEIDNILQNATTSAGMLGQGITATMPQMQFGQLTNPQSGQVIGAGVSGNNPALDQAVQRAVLIAQSGGGDAAARATLSGFGQAGLNAYIQAMQQGGSYNPTMMDAQATAGAGLGTATTQANTETLKTIQDQINMIDATAPAAQNALQTAIGTVSRLGLLGSQPIINEIRNKVNDNLISLADSTAIQQQLQSAINLYNQIPGVQAVSLDNLNASQLNQVMSSLQNTVGVSRSALIQKRNQLQNSGASGGSVNTYTGSTGGSGGGLFNW